MQKVKLTAQLFTLRELLCGKTEKEIFGVLEEVRSMGYEAVQISAVGAISRELATVYSESCHKLGLEIALSHTDFSWLDSKFDWVVEYHKSWGCQYIGIGAMPPEYRDSCEGYLRFIQECNVIAANLAKHGLVLFYHNHQFEFEKRGEQSGMELLFAGLDRRIEFVLDTCWVQVGGASPSVWIDKCAARMNAIHYKDVIIENGQPQVAEVGAGNLDWPGIIAATKRAQIRYVVVEQDECKVSPLESLKISMQFLRNWF